MAPTLSPFDLWHGVCEVHSQFCAMQLDAWCATLAAMAYLGVAGEVAAQQVIAQGGGVGSLQMALLDRLQLLDEASFAQRLKLEMMTSA